MLSSHLSLGASLAVSLGSIASAYAAPCVAIHTISNESIESSVDPRAELAPNCTIHALDAFGRAAEGLELDVVVRDEDGAARTMRCAVGADGRADLSKVEGTVVHASAAGDWFATAETWWLDGDDERGLLTVVPRVPVEVTLASHDGEAYQLFAADFDSLSMASGANAYLNGASCSEVGGVTSDGTLRVTVPRGHTIMNVFVPGSFGLSGHLPIAEGIFAGELTSIEFAITGGTQRFDLRTLPFSARPVTWWEDDDPVAGARWTPCETALFGLPEFRERMGGVTDAEGRMAVLEALDSEGELDRFLEAGFRIAREGEPDAAFVFSVPPVPEDGFEIELASEVPSVALPDAPDGYAWTFHANEMPAAQALVTDGATPVGFEGRHQGWATLAGASVARGVVHYDGWLWGAYERDVEFTEQRARLALDGLPEIDWALEAFAAFVEEDAAYVEHYVLSPVDRRGRVRSFGPIGVETSLLHGRGPGWCGDALLLAEEGDRLAPVLAGDLVEVRFVDAAGEPVPFVRFEAEWFDVFMGPGGLQGWSDEEGRAVVQRLALDDEALDEDDAPAFGVRLAPGEGLPGTVRLLEFDDEGVATVVVPECGSLAIDATKIVGGDPRPLLVRVAAGTEGDGGGSPRERRDSTLAMTTNPDGTLVLDGVPKGSYRVWACDVDLFFDSEAPSAVLTVD